MIILIAILPGITNLSALVGLFTINAAMILFGLVMEQVNGRDQPVDWWPLIFGCVRPKPSTRHHARASD